MHIMTHEICIFSSQCINLKATEPKQIQIQIQCAAIFIPLYEKKSVMAAKETLLVYSIQ